MSTVKITYETLFDLLRREKSREPLQPLDETFYEDVKDYLNDKLALLGSNDSFFNSESEKTKIQVQNILKIIREFYERREQKIIKIASDKVRTGSNIIDTSNLLPTEREYFEIIVTIMQTNKSKMLTPILNMRPGSQTYIAPKTSVEERHEELVKEEVSEEAEEEAEEVVVEPEKPSLDDNNSVAASEEEVSEETNEETSFDGMTEEEEDRIVKVKFLKSVPKFVGKELETYGPFEPEDDASLPNIIAKILITKGRAVEVN